MKKQESKQKQGSKRAPLSGSHDPQLKGWRLWISRLSLCVLAPLIFFGLLEFGLRLGGYGYPTEFFLGPDVRGSYRTNNRFGLRFFPRSLARSPWECVLSPKESGVTRIFVLGSSAARGTPNDRYGFGRVLEAMLRQRYPGRQFEVVNGAMVAINSHVALEIASDCVALEPDVFVVYMGNNEVVGPYGPGTIFQRPVRSLRVIRASIWVKKTRVGQLLGDLAHFIRGNKETVSSWQGMEMFVENRVAADDPRMEAVYDNFRCNLTDICKVGRRAGAKVMLSTLAVNLGDCPPFASMHRTDLSKNDLARWDATFQAGAGLETSNRWQEAAEQYESAALIDGRFAELQFRLGRCLMKEGRLSESREHFDLARDLDALRFRADSRINAAIRDVVAEQKSEGVCLVDVEQAFAQSDPAADRALFYEHVHLTFDGNHLLARTVLDEVGKALPELTAAREPGPVPSRQECADLLALTPLDEFQMVSSMAEMTKEKPFTGQMDHALRQTEAQAKAKQLESLASTPEAIERARQTYRNALARTPNDFWLHVGFGNVLNARRCFDEANAEFQKALAANPDSVMAHLNLGVALNGLGRNDEAVDQFEVAVRLSADVPDMLNYLAHYNLGNVLRQVGRLPEAIEHLEKVLRVRPDNHEIHFNLALALEQAGRLQSAVEHYSEAVRLNGDMPVALNNLAWIRATSEDRRLRDGAEAIRLAERACRLTGRRLFAPLDTLAAAYAETGRFPEAVAMAQEALALARSAGQEESAGEIESHLSVYRAGKVYRQKPRSPLAVR